MKKYITIVNLILIAAVIHFGVKGFYKIAAAKLETADVAGAVPKAASPAESESPPPLSRYQPIFERQLFGKAEIAETTAKPEEIQIDALKQTDLKLKLWGTVVGGDQAASAVIEAERAGQNLYHVGDTIENAVIKAILREKVVLNVDGQDEILEMEQMQTAKGAPPRPIRQARAERTQQLQRLNLQRSQIENAVQNSGRLLQEIRIRPHFEKGKMDGLTVTGIRPDSIFRKMGLISGDVLTAVDGNKIGSVDDAMKLYESMKNATSVKVDIKRRGRPQTIEYHIE